MASTYYLSTSLIREMNSIRPKGACASVMSRGHVTLIHGITALRVVFGSSMSHSKTSLLSNQRTTDTLGICLGAHSKLSRSKKIPQLLITHAFSKCIVIDHDHAIGLCEP
jgi:hypothetical protein